MSAMYWRLNASLYLAQYGSRQEVWPRVNFELFALYDAVWAISY